VLFDISIGAFLAVTAVDLVQVLRRVYAILSANVRDEIGHDSA